jgi:hypothetical protein
MNDDGSNCGRGKEMNMFSLELDEEGNKNEKIYGLCHDK